MHSNSFTYHLYFASTSIAILTLFVCVCVYCVILLIIMSSDGIQHLLKYCSVKLKNVWFSLTGHIKCKSSNKKHQDFIHLLSSVFTVDQTNPKKNKLKSDLWLNLLTCNIWTESDCTTNLFTDYHKLINYEVMMCPNGLIIAFSQTDHIVPCGRRLPHIFSQKKRAAVLTLFTASAALTHVTQCSDPNVAAEMLISYG